MRQTHAQPQLREPTINTRLTPPPQPYSTFLSLSLSFSLYHPHSHSYQQQQQVKYEGSAVVVDSSGPSAVPDLDVAVAR